jgi:V8-like Glu-specific endopeptidase
MKITIKEILRGAILGIIIGVILFNTVRILSAPEAPKTTVATYTQSVVRLALNGRTFCSGVVIDKNTVATAGHCLIECEPLLGFCQVQSNPIEIRTSDNKLIALGKAKSVTQQLDRGIIKGDFSRVKPAPYISDVTKSIGTRKVGMQYMSCGYPLGGALYCSKTIYLRNIGFQVAVDGVLIPGMSGGPTMLEDGTVVGVNSAVSDDFSIISPIYNIDADK